MRVAYLDTSAAIKIVLREPERDALLEHLDDPRLVLTASWLLHTEMLCAAGRRPDAVPAELAWHALDQVEFVDLTRADLIGAARFTPLRSADALHLATALRLQVDEILTYDRELVDAAPRFGLRAVSPA